MSKFTVSYRAHSPVDALQAVLASEADSLSPEANALGRSVRPAARWYGLATFLHGALLFAPGAAWGQIARMTVEAPRTPGAHVNLVVQCDGVAQGPATSAVVAARAWARSVDERALALASPVGAGKQSATRGEPDEVDRAL